MFLSSLMTGLDWLVLDEHKSAMECMLLLIQIINIILDDTKLSEQFRFLLVFSEG